MTRKPKVAESIAFRTRARTIDHLGREQIADCPTAISELWKNAYDAYAREVALHIYDGNNPIAVIVDNGHGMDRQDFIDKWLVIGTESKTTLTEVPKKDRNSLPPRPKQGQKGIGRLSSAFLGPLLLVVSKRRNSHFVASLIDWRLFENPYLYLQDVQIPVVEIETKDELFDRLPDMFDTLMGNIWGSKAIKSDDRDERIKLAWKAFDDQEYRERKTALAEHSNNIQNKKDRTTREKIENVMIETAFESRHFEQWPVWNGESEHGTMLAIADIVFDLEAQLDRPVLPEDTGAAEQARQRLVQTFSTFIDPYSDNQEATEGFSAGDFEYQISSWRDSARKIVISDEREFGYGDLEELEFVVDGQVDEKGTFTGRIKAFGKWLKGNVAIPFKTDVPTRSDSRVGSFHIRMGTFSLEARNSSHPPEQHRFLLEQAKKNGGFMVFRNGLRVMPYGREDNDFFEIEKRRSLHAGRHFWANRRTFGRVAITRERNPNLKDKAGREGIIDNKASKVFRDIVEGILRKAAFDYFGTDADLRSKYLPGIKETRKQEKADEERKKRRASLRKKFRANLRKFQPLIETLLISIESLSDRLLSNPPTSETIILEAREQLSEFKSDLKELRLGEAPRNLGKLEEEYIGFRNNQRRCSELIDELDASLLEAYEEIKPKDPIEVARADLNRNAAMLHNRIRKWSKEGKKLLTEENQRFTEMVDQRNKLYHAHALPLLDDLENNRISLGEVLTRLQDDREDLDLDNAGIFEPYLGALNSLKENIDLVTLADHGMDVVDELKEEVDRLHALAQLGITVEIIGHEIESLELTVSDGLQHLPKEVQRTATFTEIQSAHHSLAERLRFLTPLKLSGETTKTKLTGKVIFEYVQRFFGEKLRAEDVSLTATKAFLRFSVFERAHRIHPVFINLINNAEYWVTRSKDYDKRIVLDVVDQKVVIGDGGPGVDEEDLKHLFSLFFTRKVRGGRGVGLYLCRANLAAGGHSIYYATEEHQKIMPGANFVIDFKGAIYD